MPTEETGDLRASAERDGGPDRDEQEQASERQRLSPVTVFETIRREGADELERPVLSLWWSGIAAGIGLSTSVLAEAVLHRALAGSPAQEVVSAFGYAIGFVLVILARLQLFTENTISVVLPVLVAWALWGGGWFRRGRAD